MNKIVRDKGRAVCSTLNIRFKQMHYFHLGTDSLKGKKKDKKTNNKTLGGYNPRLPVRKLQIPTEGDCC